VTGGTPVWVIALLAVAQGVFRSTGMTTYSTVGYVEMPAEEMRDANTLMATSQQLAIGLAVAVATVSLRFGRLLPSGGPLGSPGKAPFTVAFWVLALIAIVPAIEAFRMRRDAGDAARRTSGPGGSRGTPGPAPAVPAADMAPGDGAGSEAGAAAAG